jgi:hypothetical protein
MYLTSSIYTINFIILTLILKWLMNVSLSLQVNVMISWQSANLYMLNCFFSSTIELEEKRIESLHISP